MTSTGRQSGSGLPTVSVLMPALNATETIEAAIDSVFSDETVAAEVLVIDDGSSDRSREVVRSYHDPADAPGEHDGCQPCFLFVMMSGRIRGIQSAYDRRVSVKPAAYLLNAYL